MAGDNSNLVDKYGTWASIILTLLTFAYFGIVKGNTAENEIVALKQWKLETVVRMDALDAKKVDKETFIMIMNGQAEIKQSIEKTNSMLLDHILKGK